MIVSKSAGRASEEYLEKWLRHKNFVTDVLRFYVITFESLSEHL